MVGQNSSDFKFDADDQEPESFYHEEWKDLRIEKLSQRVTLLTILLPCLIAAAAYFGYQDIKSRINRNHDSAFSEIQRISKEIESLNRDFNEKLVAFSTTLSTQDKDFGTSIEGRLIATNKNFDLLQENFKSLRKELRQNLKLKQETIEKLKSTKVEKKDQAVAIEKINAVIDPLEKELQEIESLKRDLKKASDTIAKLENKLANQLETLRTAARKDGQNYAQIEASITKLSNDTIDKDALALEIFKLKKNLQSQIAQEVSDIYERLDTIQSGGMIPGTQKQSLKRVSQEAASQQSGAASKTGTGGATAPAEPRTITEKDLIE
jgi:DNA repair exonuclease SbcCD ATPase subunit